MCGGGEVAKIGGLYDHYASSFSKACSLGFNLAGNINGKSKDSDVDAAPDF